MKNKILSFLVEYLNEINEIDLTIEELNNYRYLDQKHIDSFGLIQFIMAIEDEFDIQIDPVDTESDEFRYLGGLTSIIERKL